MGKKEISNSKIKGIRNGVLTNVQQLDGFGFCYSICGTVNSSTVTDGNLEFPTDILRIKQALKVGASHSQHSFGSRLLP